MLDKLTQRIMDSLHRSAKNTIVPVKEALKKNVNTQMDIGGKVLKFGTLILILLGVMKTREQDSRQPRTEVPGTIVINNYIRDAREKEVANDYRD